MKELYRNENDIYKICGLLKRQGDYVFLSIPYEPYFTPVNSGHKEVQYLTEFGDVEIYSGFKDLEIEECSTDDDKVDIAIKYLSTTEQSVGIIFLKNDNFLIITDSIFFSAFLRINGEDKPYISEVENFTLEDDEATEAVEADYRLN